MKIFASLGSWFAAHRKMGIAAIILLAIGLGVGAYFAVQEYQYRQSAAYGLEQLQKALNPPDPHELAQLVDFRALGMEMARAGREVFPFLHEAAQGGDRERSISRAIQKALLQRFLEKPGGKQFPEEESEEKELQKPLAILPEDLATQLASSAKIIQSGPETAVIAATVTNKQLKRDFHLELGMRRGDGGWQVRQLLNALGLARELREAMLARYAALRKVFVDKNAATTRKMNDAMQIQSCSADAGVLSDGKTFIMIVHARAKNTGNVQVNNFNLDTPVTGRNGQVMWRRYLNAAKPVAPGAMFDHRWSFELDAKDPLAQKLLRAQPLQCRPHWQTLSLANGQVWHMAEIPNPDRACDKPGHDHPMGFCIIPSFLPE